MFCSNCGKQIDAAARFCPACGTAAQAAGFANGPCVAQSPVFGKLVRPRYPRTLGGVCSGPALHYGWDVTTVRLIWVLCVVFGGTGILMYIIAWIVIPEEPYDSPASNYTGSGV